MTEDRKLTIPQIRDALLGTAAELETYECVPASLVAQLRYLESQLYRRPPVRRQPREIATTDAQRQAVLALAALHPDWSYQRISAATGLNSGRISEILAGKRGET